MRRHRLPFSTPLALTLLSLLAGGGGALGEPPAPAPAALEAHRTVDARASVFTDSEQAHASLDLGPADRSLVAWDSRRQEAGTSGVFARVLDAAGRPATHERRVNVTLAGAQRRPAVAWASDGAAWIAWESWGQDGDGAGVVLRRFGPDLEPRGPELAVNVERDGDQTGPVVAAGPAGAALVAWSSDLGADPGALRPARGIRARLFDPSGRPRGGEIAVSAPGAAQDELASLAARGAAGFVVVWARAGAEATAPGIWVRVLSAGGLPQGDELLVSRGGATSGQDIEPAIAADRRGGFVVAWLTSTPTGYRPCWRRFTPEASPAGPIVEVATPAAGWVSGVALAVAPDGRFAVSFNHQAGGDEGQDLWAALYTADGRAAASPRRVTAASAGDQAGDVASGARRSAWNGDDLIAFAWSGDGGDDDATAANLTLLVPPGLVPAPRVDLGPAQAAPPVSSAAIAAPQPPIWNPDFRPQRRLPAGVQAGGDFGFEAIAGSPWTPPDPEMAVGPGRIVVMTNGAIATFDKLGNQTWRDEIENSFGFWGELGANNFVFDPEVKWDPHSSRFFAMASERSDNSRSYFLLAVSKDSQPDDRNDWYKYRIDVTALSDNDIDSPNLALSTDYVLLTADFFGPDKYLIYIIDKASILGGGAPVATSELIVGASQQSMGIPVVNSDTATLYILQSTENGNNTTVILHAITSPFTAYQRQTFTLPVPPYTFPNQPPQKGSSSRPFLFEPRFWSVAERNGSLWAVHHVNSTRARVRWYEIPLNGWPGAGTPSLRQEGEIDLGGEIHTYFPSIHVDAQENVAITFARSAPNEYISMGRAVRAAGDPLDTLRPVQVVQVSQNPHTSGRWGDYSGTQADPVEPDSFWGHHEFTNGAQTSWRTWVARYDLRSQPMLLSSGPPVAGQPITFTVTGATPGQRVYFTYSTIGTGITELPGLHAVLSLELPRLATAVTADGGGGASFTVTIPPGAGGRTLWMQAAEDRFTSNWLRLDVP